MLEDIGILSSELEHASRVGMDWGRATEEYEFALRAAGRAEQTIVHYLHYLSIMRRKISNKHIREVTYIDLIKIMGQRQWGPAARKSFRTAIVGFFRWAQGTGLIEEDPAKSLPTVKMPQGRARPIPEHNFDWALLAESDPRIYLMLKLGGLYGLRAGEIARVHHNDLTKITVIRHRLDGTPYPFEIYSLRVHGKGNKEREIPISDADLVAAIKGAEDYLFPSPLGGHLTPNHVSKLISRSLEAHWTSHNLRHRFATVGYARTGDLLAVSKALGHASTVTTQIYVQMPLENEVNLMEAASHIGPAQPYYKTSPLPKH